MHKIRSPDECHTNSSHGILFGLAKQLRSQLLIRSAQVSSDVQRKPAVNFPRPFLFRPGRRPPGRRSGLSSKRKSFMPTGRDSKGSNSGRRTLVFLPLRSASVGALFAHEPFPARQPCINRSRCPPAVPHFPSQLRLPALLDQLRAELFNKVRKAYPVSKADLASSCSAIFFDAHGWAIPPSKPRMVISRSISK